MNGSSAQEAPLAKLRTLIALQAVLRSKPDIQSLPTMPRCGRSKRPFVDRAAF